MSITLGQKVLTSATSGTTITTTALGSTPTQGQLLLACLRLPTPSTTANNSGITPPTGFNFIFSAPNSSGSGTYAALMYKIAGLNEPTTITASWPGGTAAAAAPSQAILEYDEFDGFLGIPTLDLSLSSTGIAVFGKPSATLTPVATTELAIAYAALGNTSGVWNPGGASQFNQTNGPAPAFSLTDGTATGYVNVGYGVATPLALSAQITSWEMQWTTSRAWSVQGVTFYDQPDVPTPIAAPLRSNIALMHSANW